MPEWRYAEIKGKTKWPLSRVAPPGEQWTDVRKPERNGIVVLIMTLYWWKVVSNGDETATGEYISAREDFAWLMTRLVICDAPATSSRSTRKRTHDDETGEAAPEHPSPRPTRKLKSKTTDGPARESRASSSAASRTRSQRADRTATVAAASGKPRRSTRK